MYVLTQLFIICYYQKYIFNINITTTTIYGNTRV